MPFHFELSTDRPTLTITASLHANTSELSAMVDGAAEWLDRIDHRVYYVIDLGDSQLSIGDIMAGAELAARGSSALLHHPNIIETLVVTTDPLVTMAAKSVGSFIYGELRLKVIGTMAEALAYVDDRVAGGLA